MRHDTRLLWIRTATPGPDYVGVFESLNSFVIQVAHSASEALARLEAEPADVVLAEFPLAAWQPSELLEAIQHANPRVPVLIRHPEGTVADAVRLIKLGAYHFMSGPLDDHELITHLEMAAEEHRLRKSAYPALGPEAEPWKHFLIGESRPIRDVEQMIRLSIRVPPANTRICHLLGR